MEVPNEYPPLEKFTDTKCNMCGDCCDPVEMSLEAWERAGALARKPYDPWGHHNMYDAVFIREHWTPVWQGTLRIDLECAFFNKTTRQCEAHDLRPPICRNYPYYGNEEMAEGTVRALLPRCSFNDDVRTMLPVLTIKE